MPVNYALVPRKNRETGEVLIYANMVAGESSLDTMAERITQKTTVTYPDVVAVIKAIQEFACEELVEGRAVHMDELGTLYPTLSSKGSETVDGFTANMIRRMNIRFRPSVKLRRATAFLNYELTTTKKSQRAALKADKESLQEDLDANNGNGQGGNG